MVIENEDGRNLHNRLKNSLEVFPRCFFFQSVELKLIAILKLQGEEIEIKADLFVALSHCWEFVTAPWAHFLFL